MFQSVPSTAFPSNFLPFIDNHHHLFAICISRHTYAHFFPFFSFIFSFPFLFHKAKYSTYIVLWLAFLRNLICLGNISVLVFIIPLHSFWHLLNIHAQCYMHNIHACTYVYNTVVTLDFLQVGPGQRSFLKSPKLLWRTLQLENCFSPVVHVSPRPHPSVLTDKATVTTLFALRTYLRVSSTPLHNPQKHSTREQSSEIFLSSPASILARRATWEGYLTLAPCSVSRFLFWYSQSKTPSAQMVFVISEQGCVMPRCGERMLLHSAEAPSPERLRPNHRTRELVPSPDNSSLY